MERRIRTIWTQRRPAREVVDAGRKAVLASSLSLPPPPTPSEIPGILEMREDEP